MNDLSSKWLGETNNSASQIPPPDDVQGDIRSACGLAKLLIDERFDQFNDLIRQAEEYIQSLKTPLSSLKSDDGDAPKVVLTSDLEGFWEMIEIQVKDVENKFEHLVKLKANDYQPLPLELTKISISDNSKPTNKQTSFKPRPFKVNNAVVASKQKSNGIKRKIFCLHGIF